MMPGKNSAKKIDCRQSISQLATPGTNAASLIINTNLSVMNLFSVIQFKYNNLFIK